MSFEDKANQKINKAQETQEPKRRGRKAKVIENPIPEAVPNEGLANFFQVLANQIMAVDKYPELKVTDEEALRWSIPHNQLLEYYLGKYGAISFVWINAGLQWATIFATRLKIIKELKRKGAENGEESNTNIRAKRKRKVNDSKATGKK